MAICSCVEYFANYRVEILNRVGAKMIGKQAQLHWGPLARGVHYDFQLSLAILCLKPYSVTIWQRTNTIWSCRWSPSWYSCRKSLVRANMFITRGWNHVLVANWTQFFISFSLVHEVMFQDGIRKKPCGSHTNVGSQPKAGCSSTLGDWSARKENLQEQNMMGLKNMVLRLWALKNHAKINGATWLRIRLKLPFLFFLYPYVCTLYARAWQIRESMASNRIHAIGFTRNLIQQRTTKVAGQEDKSHACEDVTALLCDV